LAEYESAAILVDQELRLDSGRQHMKWDYWSAVLYAGSLCTTIGTSMSHDIQYYSIGYGHVYPRTTAGRVLTMLYSLGGIPLVLLLLQDMGQLLTVTMKYPWFQFKRLFRRLLRLEFSFFLKIRNNFKNI
jgi:hypothetical protein